MGISKLFNRGKDALKESMERFPIAIILSMTLTIIMIYMTETQKFGWEYSFSRIAAVLGLGIPLFLCLHLILERRNKEKDNVRYIYFAGGAFFLLIYGIFVYNAITMVIVTRHVALISMFTLGFLFIPYVNKSENYEMYIIKVLERFFTTILYSIVLQIGISAILFTLDYLLGITVKFELYAYTWLIVVGVFAPCFFLGGIPTKDETISVKHYPKGLKVLMLYIIMPLISIYTVILYIYFGKIVITMTWPEGLVSNLVLWYGVISAGTIFLISALVNDSQWSKKYMKVFPKAILPLMVMMFISMGIRINAYGITENRYYVLALGIWVFGVMLYFSISKKKKNIFLPVSLAIIIFISVLGPLSSYNLSKYSQNKRFKEIIIRNNMMENGKMVKSTKKVTQGDQNDIISIFNYFERNHDLKDIKYLPEDFRITDLESEFGIMYYPGDLYNFNSSLSSTKYFNFVLEDSMLPIEVEGYDYIFDIVSSGMAGKKIKQGLEVGFDNSYNEFILYNDGEEIFYKDFNEYTEKLLEEYEAQENYHIPREELTFEEETDKVKIKFIFSNLSGEMSLENETINYIEYDVCVLVKIK